MQRLCLTLPFAVALTGCVAAHYTKPEVTDEPALHQVVVDQPLEEVMSAIRLYGVSNFYQTEWEEREQGKLVLSFQTADPTLLASGGQWKSVARHETYEGDYLQFLMSKYNIYAKGRVDVQATPLGERRTQVTVGVKYHVTLPLAGGKAPVNWIFQTGECATARIKGGAMGTDNTRTLCPTHAIERSMLEAATKAGQ